MSEVKVTDEHGDRRDAIDVARDFVREQAMGEWGDEVEERDAQKLASLLNAFLAARSREWIVPWAFAGQDCLHARGYEDGCRIPGCPRKANDLGRSALSETIGEGGE